MSYRPNKTFSIDGRLDIPSNGWKRAKRKLAAMGGIKGRDERHKPAASSASLQLVNLRRSFSPDPALAQVLPVPVGHADLI